MKYGNIHFFRQSVTADILYTDFLVATKVYEMKDIHKTFYRGVFTAKLNFALFPPPTPLPLYYFFLFFPNFYDISNIFVVLSHGGSVIIFFFAKNMTHYKKLKNSSTN